MKRAFVCIYLLLATATLSAAPADDWLDGLTDKVIADVAAGKPLVVDVDVPLCQTGITACGNKKLGDGETPSTNLYWSTTPGFGSWFDHRPGRKTTGWKRALLTTTETGDKDILELRVYRRTVTASASWRKKGAPKTFDVILVLRAWRGSQIDRALAAYAADVSGQGSRTVKLADGSEVTAGGAAQIVAFVGHNRLMDLDSFTWPTPGTDKKGTIAIACETAAYMKRDVPAETRVPLLMTSDFLFSNAAPLEAAVLAFAEGGGYARIRRDAAAAYALVQDKDVKRVAGAFTNPSDRRWAK
jgi:hypothetical protein